MDAWSEKQINMMQKGGNEKLAQFFEKYDLGSNTSIGDKYKSIAATYYKKKLKAEISGELFSEMEPGYDQGRLMCEDYKPRVNDMSGFGNTNFQNQDQNGDGWNGFFQNLTKEVAAGVSYAADKTSKATKTVSTKIQEGGYVESIKSTAQNVATKSKDWTITAATKSKEIGMNIAKTTKETTDFYIHGNNNEGENQQRQSQEQGQQDQKSQEKYADLKASVNTGLKTTVSSLKWGFASAAGFIQSKIAQKEEEEKSPWEHLKKVEGGSNSNGGSNAQNYGATEVASGLANVNLSGQSQQSSLQGGSATEGEKKSKWTEDFDSDDDTQASKKKANVSSQQTSTTVKETNTNATTATTTDKKKKDPEDAGWDWNDDDF
eukprot:CAMPEP_0114993668 /NCGR_PEP_ID=MMETSP0216-20121206/12668_1 /TAXON_ID=223996 /ORGANISM="Protocruzia adherens, Strain Boccale" /LENGTH=375 /DNA_ID=CAMNT_0002357357 /DNA_START=249 /DNA_END=1376 /DNA_ORIENTATION=-